MALQVIRGHGNAWDVQMLRKVVKRTSSTGTVGGSPNLGGLAVLDSNDETDFEYEFLCNGHALKAEFFQPGNMTDRMDAAIGGAEEFLYMLAREKDPNDLTAHLQPLTTKTLVLFILGEGEGAARLAYEVATVDATCELPPFLPRYVLNRRAEMDLPAGFAWEKTDDAPPDPEPDETDPNQVVAPLQDGDGKLLATAPGTSTGGALRDLSNL